MAGSGTKDDPWQLTTAPGTSQYTMHRDDMSRAPARVRVCVCVFRLNAGEWRGKGPLIKTVWGLVVTGGLWQRQEGLGAGGE